MVLGVRRLLDLVLSPVIHRVWSIACLAVVATIFGIILVISGTYGFLLATFVYLFLLVLPELYDWYVIGIILLSFLLRYGWKILFTLAADVSAGMWLLSKSMLPWTLSMAVQWI